ncbi:type IV secretory system conjugative DNA transfer family protein [Devosia sp. 1566]|uniref:type IV secretory system conjugative DNA transfer family protein n=1 Tax=Devosia sp. 1566 TaxID=2499144 RepID=UPI000FDABF28|nr:type IV secretory system conjugative DNA transfer family protein [Devosia sp. 1566]
MPQFPTDLLGWALFVAVVGFFIWVLWGLFGREWMRDWRRKHPVDRTAEGGPWRGGFLDEVDLKHLGRNRGGLPLGIHAGKIVRYVKDDEKGWLGGHHAVIAGTRGGKSVSALVPAILDHVGPVVALDIKGELATITGKRRETTDRKVVMLDPFRTTKTRGFAYNPLSFIRDGHRDRDAAVIADGLVLTETGDGAHFSDRARDILQTAIEVVHELTGAKANLHDVRSLVLNANFLDTLAAWSDASDLAGGRAAELAGSLLQMGDKERGAILSTVARSLKWTSAGHMRAFLAPEKGFQLDLLLKGNVDLFIVIPLDQIGPQAGFLRLLTNLLLAVMVQQDDRGKAEQPVLFVADEFTRLGFMQRIVDIATVAAGMSLETIFVLQDRGSLEAVYGQYAADTILGSCATTRVFNLGRADLRTAKWLSDACGFKTVLSEGKTFQKISNDQATSQSEVKESLLSVSEILELPADQMICLIRGRSPAKLGRIFHFSNPNYRIQK